MVSEQSTATIADIVRKFREAEQLYEDILSPERVYNELSDASMVSRQQRALSVVSVMRTLFHQLAGGEPLGSSVLFYALSLRWPKFGGFEERTFKGTVTPTPGQTMSQLYEQLLAAYLKQINLPEDAVVVLNWALTPEHVL